MLSYKPLSITLKKSEKDVQFLASKIGMNKDKLRDVLNQNKSLSFKRIDKICRVLNCSVSDVLEYEPSNEYVTLDWEKVSKFNKPLTVLSKECGLSRATLLNAKNGGNVVKFKTASKLANYLNCKVEDII